MNIIAEKDMLANGKKINSMDLDKKLGQVKKFMKEITWMEPNMEMELSNILMALNIQVNSKTMKFVEKELMNGQMVENM